MIAMGYPVLWRYMMWYFTLGLTSFLYSAENPTAVYFPYAAAGSHSLFRHNVSWCGIFPRTPFGPWKYPSFQLPLFPPLTLKQPFYHLFILKAIVFCNFPLSFPLCKHSLDLRQQCLNVCVNPFSHGKAPWCSLFSYIRGLLSLSVFTGHVYFW